MLIFKIIKKLERLKTKTIVDLGDLVILFQDILFSNFQYSKHLYSALRQFLQIFPELRTAPLYLAGESYAGKYVPALGMAIHSHKLSPGGDINLKVNDLGIDCLQIILKSYEESY